MTNDIITISDTQLAFVTIGIYHDMLRDLPEVPLCQSHFPQHLGRLDWDADSVGIGGGGGGGSGGPNITSPPPPPLYTWNVRVRAT